MSTLLSSLLFGSGSTPGVAGTFSASGILATVEMAYTTDLLDVPSAWTDITPWVRRMSTRRGRNHELGKTAAGVATITLDNRDRRFDPTFTSSPYYPDLVPMTHIRINATYNAVTYPVFYGFVEDWGQSWPEPAANGMGDATVDVQAVDAFKVFNLLNLTSYPSAVGADSPVAYYPLAGGSAAAAGSTDLTGTFEGALVLEAGPLIASGNVPDFTAAYVDLPDASAFDDLADKSMTLELWMRPESVASGSRVVFGDDVWFLTTNTGDDLLWGYDSANPTDQPQITATAALTANTWYHVACVRDWETGRLRIYVNGVEVQSGAFGRFATGTSRSDYTISSDFPIFPGRIAHVAIYSTVLTANRVAAHYAAGVDQIENVTSGAAVGHVLDAVGWPVGLRDIETGASTVTLDPTGSALNLLQEVAEETEQGIFFMAADNTATFISRSTLEASVTSVATFGDGAGEVPYQDLAFSYDDQDLWTEVSASGADDAKALVTDSTAATRYGVRTLEVSGVAADENQVADLANGLLTRYHAPAMRPTTLTLAKAAAATQQMARLIGDRVTIKRRPPGGGTMSVDAIIEGIDHDVSTDGWLVTTFSLVPANSNVPWLLADTTYGILDSTTDLGW